MGVDDVECTGDGGDDHANHDKGEEDVRDQPAIPEVVLSGDAEAIEADGTKDEHRQNQNDAEFWFKDAAVESDHEPVEAVGKQSRGKEADHAANKGACVQVTRFKFVEKKRRAEKDGCDDHADQDRPADDDALDKTGPQNT